MPIVAARIDDRLLHGIVATKWVPEYKPQRLMVIDDEYANDPTKKAAMRMARPAGIALSIISEETALANFTNGKYDDHTVFVIAREPQTVLQVMETGQVIPKLVVGGTVSPAEGESATRVSRRAFVFDWERDVYRAILNKGCDINVQYTPADKSDSLASLIAL